MVVAPLLFDPSRLVRMQAAGVCHSDLHTYRDEYMSTFPLLPGHEFRGRAALVNIQVHGVSAAALHLAPGHRLIAACNRDHQQLCVGHRQTPVGADQCAGAAGDPFTQGGGIGRRLARQQCIAQPPTRQCDGLDAEAPDGHACIPAGHALAHQVAHFARAAAGALPGPRDIKSRRQLEVQPPARIRADAVGIP